VKVEVSPLTPIISSRKYVVAPSADATPPTLTEAAAVTEGVLVGTDRLTPEGMEKLGTDGVEVGAGRTSVTAA
jgi:hypothetical protein